MQGDGSDNGSEILDTDNNYTESDNGIKNADNGKHNKNNKKVGNINNTKLNYLHNRITPGSFLEHATIFL